MIEDPGTSAGQNVGRVIGTKASQPLEFWLGVQPDSFVQLDEVVAVTTTLPTALPDGRDQVEHYGIVDIIESTHEGASFHSDVFRTKRPVGLATIAHVSVTRVEPEVFVPPTPGSGVRRASEADRETGLYFDVMKRKFIAGFSRDQSIVWGNLDFLDGRKGAHVNISGISGVATKTSYALFLLYGLFHSDRLEHPHSTHAIVFNVKGEDLLWIDKGNNKLDSEHPEARPLYEKARLPVGPFESVGIWAPAQAGTIPLPDTHTRLEGVTAYFWTLREFCRERMLKFLFAEADDESSQLEHVARHIGNILHEQMEHQTAGRGDITLLCEKGEVHIDSLESLADFIEEHIEELAPARTFPQTSRSFVNRFHAAASAVSRLIRAVPDEAAEPNRFDWTKAQVSVIDINKLSERAKRFVVGVVMKRLLDDKDKGGDRDNLVFLVLDELNKYAPRDDHSPIKDVVLEIAERGRSLGVVLIGAQQTASEIERRVTANASFRVVGRLDAAEGQRNEYGFLSSSARTRSLILKPGSVFMQQPDVPVPLLVQFPFPAWATRPDEAILASGSDNGNVIFERARRRLE